MACTLTRPNAAPAPSTLGAALERRRLEHRIVRLERVLASLHDRAVYRATQGQVPEPLRQAIAGFDAEVQALRRQLS